MSCHFQKLLYTVCRGSFSSGNYLYGVLLWQATARNGIEEGMSFGELYDRVLKEYPGILTIEKKSQAPDISIKNRVLFALENKIALFKMGRASRIPKAHLLTYLRLDAITVSSP